MNKKTKIVTNKNKAINVNINDKGKRIFINDKKCKNKDIEKQ